MSVFIRACLCAVVLLGLGGLIAEPPSRAASATPDQLADTRQRGKSGLLLPRFVSINQNLANVRRGPGKEYPLLWQYQRSGIPLEIIAEYGDWRHIRDYDGSEGWMHKRLLRGPRMVKLRGTDTSLALRSQAKPEAGVLARVQAGRFARLDACQIGWCRLQIGQHTGWMRRPDIWGVYDFEFNQ